MAKGTSWRQVVALSILAVALTGSATHAALIRYDLRAVRVGTVGGRVRDAKHVEIGAPRGRVKMEVWAMVENTNGDNADDAFVLTHLSFLSNGGDLRGDLIATNSPFFNFKNPEPGRQRDLDDDGDLDVGDNRIETVGINLDHPWPWFMAFGNFRPWSDVPETLKTTEIQDGQTYSSFLIGSLNFSFENLNPGFDLTTAINIRPRVKTDGLIAARRAHLFDQDGTRYRLEGTDPRVMVGAPVNISTIPTHMPEPATWLLAVIGSAALLAYRRRMRQRGSFDVR